MRFRKGRRTPHHHHTAEFLPAIAVALVVACGNEPSGPSGIAASMEVVSGDDQSAIVGTELVAPLIVRVLDSAGTPVQGQLVNFVVTAGGGHVFAGASISDVNGLSQERWTLGTSTADTQRVEARSVDNNTGQPLVFATFHATAIAGPPTSLLRIQGDSQVAAAGFPLPDSLAVRVLDQYGNPVIGTSVAWAAVTGGGTVSPSLSASDASGRAASQWSPGSVGPATAQAAAGAIPPVVFTATAYYRPTYSTISAGVGTTCGVAGTGVAYCWGNNRWGALGVSTTTISTRPVAVTGSDTFATVATGGTATCGVGAGTTFCWGANIWGLLGRGVWTTVPGDSLFPMPAPVAGGWSFASLDASNNNVCALAASGGVYCWGWPPAADSANRPTLVPGGDALTSMTLGTYGGHACGLTPAGVAYCWGSNLRGQLGDSTTTDRATPTPVASGLAFSSITAGSLHACALTSAGTAYCWGQDSVAGAAAYDICDGFPCTPAPAPVAGGLIFTEISAGRDHTCALTMAGAAYCWGKAGFEAGASALGDGTSSDRLTPVPVAGGLTFVSISAGDGHTCARTAAGAAYCWGANGLGQLGNGNTTPSLFPVLVVDP